MGDIRFERQIARLRETADRPAALRSAKTDDLIMALAAVSAQREPLLANILATELLNRARRQGAVAENIAEGVYIVDHDSIITYVNPSAERLLGVAAADLVGKRADAIRIRDPGGALIPWEDRPTRRAVMEGLVSAPAELWIDRKDGSLMPVAMMAGPIRADGDILGAVLSFRDTTRERQAHAEVLFHKQLLDAVGEAVVATRPDGAIVYWNRAAEALFGWPAKDVLGRNVVWVAPSEEAREASEAIMARMRRGETWSGVFPLRHRSGGTFLGHVTNAPVRDERGDLVAIVGVSRPLEQPPRPPQRPSRGIP